MKTVRFIGFTILSILLAISLSACGGGGGGGDGGNGDGGTIGILTGSWSGV